MDVMSHKIIDYRPEHQPWFERLNRAWIEEHFGMEPIDEAVLGKPEEHILKSGGAILMIEYQNEIVGTAALKYVSEGIYEFTKMAVDEKFRGRKIGQALVEASIEKARTLGAHTVVLYSGTKLVPAITLYRKLGFHEIPLDGPYKRADIKMALPLDRTKAHTYVMRQAVPEDAAALCAFGIKAFRDTFEAANTAENMKLYLDNNFTEDKLRAELTDTTSVFLLFYDNDVLAGYIKLRSGHEPEALKSLRPLEIERLYVAQEHLGRYVGFTLMQSAIRYGKLHGFDVLWLGVWEHNLKARRFYEKCGFETFGSHIFMLGTDAQTDLLMKKGL